MSRIFVRNLPKYVTEDRLRDLFSQKGEITEAKLMRNREGENRQFAFIGFRTEQEGQEAIKYFNRSYIDTRRISCETALKVGDPNIPRPWSRHSVKNKDRAAEGGKRVSGGHSIILIPNREKKNRKKASERDDPQLQEFLQVMQPRTKSKLWANDTLVASTDRPNGSFDGRRTRAKKSIKEKSIEAKVENNRPDEPERRGRANPSSSSTNVKDGIMEIGCLFVHNLPYMTSKEELEELFSKFGKIEDVHIVVHKTTRLSKGVGYIQYALPESASRAFEELDNSSFQGRLLHVMPALQKIAHKRQDDLTSNQAPKTFKQRREEDRKASEASGDTKAWNTLFMRPDTVVENIARKYGISKSDFLDREADDLAVRIALGETQVIAETKKALTDAGVNIASLEKHASRRTEGLERSDHVLLVKNLPYGCSSTELTKMFRKFGSVDIILPPTKTMALVVFLEPSEAQAALNGLAYKRYKDAPLYLERAPGNVLNPTIEPNGRGLKADKDTSFTKLHVKNVAFEATKEDLEKLFSPFGEIERLALPRKSGNHRGFAFVEYATKQEAQNALQTLANSHVYGRHLVLERAKEDESLDGLRARTAARFNNEDGYRTAKLSKKRKRAAVLDEDKRSSKESRSTPAKFEFQTTYLIKELLRAMACKGEEDGVCNVCSDWPSLILCLW